MINQPGSKIMVEPAKDGKPPCRYALFVKLWPYERSSFPEGVRLFTFRGDKYTTVENYMLEKLIRHIISKGKKYNLMELYDNTYQKDDPCRLILKVFEKEVCRPSHIMLYKQQGFLKNLAVPDYLF